MTSKIFPLFLQKLAIKKYPNRDPNESFLRLLDHNLYPLYIVLYSNTNIGLIDKIVREEIPFPIYILINLKQQELFDIHSKYFKNDRFEKWDQFD